MVLYLIGLGLGDEKDITVKGLEAVKKCKTVYLEHYTSILSVGKERLEKYYEREVILADRELVESEAEEKLLLPAREDDIGLLVVGDPFGATTHADLVLRAKKMGVECVVCHNASIMNAVGCCGLQLYTFGQTISMVFFTENWRPDSFYNKVLANRKMGLHTLCLLDIKVKEQSDENMLRGRKIYEPPRFMSVHQCIEQLLEVEQKRQENAYSEETMCVGLARVGQETQQIAAGTMKELLEVSFGEPLHSFIICGELQPMEEEYIEFFRAGKSSHAS
ncbi:diphthine synthase [Balamuthia mandrillaris]